MGIRYWEGQPVGIHAFLLGHDPFDDRLTILWRRWSACIISYLYARWKKKYFCFVYSTYGGRDSVPHPQLPEGHGGRGGHVQRVDTACHGDFYDAVAGIESGFGQACILGAQANGHPGNREQARIVQRPAVFPKRQADHGEPRLLEQGQRFAPLRPGPGQQVGERTMASAFSAAAERKIAPTLEGSVMPSSSATRRLP